MKRILIAPSVLAADFANVAQAVREIETAGADIVHCDIMDGSFVPSITFGAQMVAAIRACTALPLDVHLMVEHPETQLEFFAKAGARWITFHPETSRHPHRVLQTIRGLGCLGGVVLNPGTPVCAVEYLLPVCDMVLLMSVNPGAGGQAFLSDTLRKAKELSARREALDLDFDIEIDGGITAETAKLAIDAGINVLVAGSSVFGAPDRKEAIEALRGGHK